jgi:hypothetical protein
MYARRDRANSREFDRGYGGGCVSAVAGCGVQIMRARSTSLSRSPGRSPVVIRWYSAGVFSSGRNRIGEKGVLHVLDIVALCLA